MLIILCSSKAAIQTSMCTCESAATAYFAQEYYDPGLDVIVIITREVPVTTGIFRIMTVRWRVMVNIALTAHLATNYSRFSSLIGCCFHFIFHFAVIF